MYVSYCCLTSSEKYTYNLSNTTFYVIYINKISQNMIKRKRKKEVRK